MGSEVESQGLKSAVDASSPVIVSSTIRTIDFHECDNIQCYFLDLAGITLLNLSYMDRLTSVRGNLPRLVSLDLSYCPELEELRGRELFGSVCPSLERLAVRGCEALRVFDGLSWAKCLRELLLNRCEALETLENVEALHWGAWDIYQNTRYMIWRHATGQESIRTLCSSERSPRHVSCLICRLMCPKLRPETNLASS